MVDAAQRELAAIGVDQVPEVLLADAGYWHQDQMETIVDRGIQVLIPPDAGKRKGNRPGWERGPYSFMRRVLDTDFGGGYAKCQGMIEPVFDHTKFNRRCDRFLRRGRAAVRSERRLITATHNLLKLSQHTTAPAAARQWPPARPRFRGSAAADPHARSHAPTRQPPWEARVLRRSASPA
jgi:hypothetical protein